MCTRVQPGRAATQEFELQLATIEIRAVQIGDFKLPSLRRTESGGKLNNLFVLEI